VLGELAFGVNIKTGKETIMWDRERRTRIGTEETRSQHRRVNVKEKYAGNPKSRAYKSNCTLQRPFSVANGCLDIQEFCAFHENEGSFPRSQESPPVPTNSQMNPFHTFQSYTKIQFNIILPSKPRSSTSSFLKLQKWNQIT
jgi:hypothetical protein